jgi:hypothetical protein
MHHIVGRGLLLRQQWNHREESLNFFSDSLDILLFLAQYRFKILHGPSSKHAAQLRTTLFASAQEFKLPDAG